MNMASKIYKTKRGDYDPRDTAQHVSKRVVVTLKTLFHDIKVMNEQYSSYKGYFKVEKTRDSLVRTGACGGYTSKSFFNGYNTTTGYDPTA